MNQKLGFETIPFDIAPEFQGEVFEEESERGGARPSPRPRSGFRSPYTAGQRPGRSPAFSPARRKKPPVRKPKPSGFRRRGPWGVPYGLVSEPYSGEPAPSGSEYTRWVQDSLNRILGLRLPVTGVMGPEIRSAVRSFQKQKGLPVSGIVGPDTEKALLDAGRPADAAAPPAEPQPEPAQDQGEFYEFETLDLESLASMPTLRQGSRGSPVADLQRRLAAVGFSPGAADGIFGSLTDAAVRSFQRARSRRRRRRRFADLGRVARHVAECSRLRCPRSAAGALHTAQRSARTHRAGRSAGMAALGQRHDHGVRPGDAPGARRLLALVPW
jgi:putative peptidoglycan binding protein